MIYHLTRREYFIILDEDGSEECAIEYCKAIEKWEVDKILNSNDPEIEKLIKQN